MFLKKTQRGELAKDGGIRQSSQNIENVPQSYPNLHAETRETLRKEIYRRAKSSGN